MRKKLLLFAILFIILSLPVRALSQGDEKVDALIRKGWVVGRGEEDYALDETITRAEFTRIVVLLEEKSFKGRSTGSRFLDVKKDAWFAPYIEEAARKQWVVGDGDGRFRPNDHITYAEVFAILTRLQDSGIAKGKPWYANYVANAEKWGYTRGIDIKDYRHKALRRHVFDGIYNVLESREKAEKSHENKTYPTLTFKFEKSEKMPEKREIPKVNEEKIHKIKLVDGDKIREINALHGKTIDKPNAEQREGYIFVGWLNGAEVFDFETPITSDIKLTAKFEPKIYTVKLTDGDQVVESQVEHGKIAEKPEVPVKEGYNFVGWFNGEEAFDFDKPITSDINLTAKFEAKTCTVKFTDGDQVVESQVEHGKIVEKPSDPVKEGYNFVGWFNGEEAFDFDKPITSDLSLTAKFEPKTYTVTFVNGDEEISQAVKHGERATEPTKPTKDDFIFLGWFDGDEEFDFENPITSDTVLNAKFAPAKVTIQIWDEEGDNLINSETIPYGSNFRFPLSVDKNYRAEYLSENTSYRMGSFIELRKDMSFRMRLIEVIQVRYLVDKGGAYDSDNKTNTFSVYLADADKDLPLENIPNFAFVSTRYPLMRYDRENGRFDPEPFDLSTPITEPIYLVSIQKGTAYRYPIFIYVEPGGNPNGHYKKVWVDKIEDIPKVDFKSGGYHTDGWREVDKAERYEFVNNFGAARGKVFVPYWVKDE